MSKAEKFIQDYTRNCSNECCGEGINVGHGVTLSKRYFTPWLTPDQAKMAVEIEREEIADKLRKWIARWNEGDSFTFDYIDWSLNELIKQIMKDE